MTGRAKHLRIAAAGAIALACYGADPWLVADPVRHVALQLPLLGLAGWLVTPRTLGRQWRWADGGFAPLLLALFGVIFWMLPRSIDGAISDPWMMTAKFVTVPAVGAALRLGWPRAHPLLRGFVKTQTISMAGFMAFLFTYAPARLCNNYLIDDQWRLGHAFLWWAIALAIGWSAQLFIVRPNARAPPPSPDYSNHLQFHSAARSTS